MTISAGDGTSAPEIPLLNDVVPTSVDFKGRPSLRSKSGRWKSAAFVIGAGWAERLSYYGISSNLVSYLTGKMGQPTATAASALNAWYGTASLLPILGAFLADSFTGRFRMIVLSSVVYILGLSFLSLSAALRQADTSKCKLASIDIASCAPNQFQLVFFFFSLYLVALAHGGLTPCLQALGADQFDEDDEAESRAKSSFFNWWYCLSIGCILLPLLVLTYIQENVSWLLGFGIPAVIMCLALALFLVGCSTYRFRVKSDGSNPFVRIGRVFVVAVRNWRATSVPALCGEEGVVSSTASQFRFLDKALLPRDGKLCSARDVEDAKSILRLVPIWFACLGYSIVYAQPAALYTKQTSTVDRHVTHSFEIPAAAFMQLFIISTVIILLPLYDRALVPLARKFTKTPPGIPLLHRISIGFLISLVSVAAAALVERRRLLAAQRAGLEDLQGAVVPMSVWWFTPQYVLAGVSDVFAMVGLQELFYGEVPGEVKSVGIAMYLSVLGVGSLMSSLMISAIQRVTSRGGQEGWFADNLNRAHLDYFYWVLVGLSAVGLVAFVCFTSRRIPDQKPIGHNHAPTDRHRGILVFYHHGHCRSRRAQTPLDSCQARVGLQARVNGADERVVVGPTVLTVWPCRGFYNGWPSGVFYDRVPVDLKSIGLSLYLSIFGTGGFLSSILISDIEKVTGGDGDFGWFANNLNRAHLDYFYWLLSGLSAVTMAAMNNGYSRIEKRPQPSSTRSKSVDFDDRSIPQCEPRSSTPNFSISSKLESKEIAKPNGTLKMKTVHEIEESPGEVFGTILGRKCQISSAKHGEIFGTILGQKCRISSGKPDQAVLDDRQVEKKLLPVRRSASVSEGYSRIHHLCGSNAESDSEDECGSELITNRRCVKKKGKFLGTFRRFFGF
ncbi:Protein NRT1/ PTR FAMILY 5.10 [Striga hermonthica]|uniref:Protein NRT1/ PTR FAMILY 5.10 n=1 Tax=Striga hermonthica TaxID=68872 RepID=A0A9N7NFK1_STRHE|nr:Protein NRT1/ PTR FAMILY 5.10 [Striga hermonthica]